MKTISDDDASGLILLKDLKPFTGINLESRQDSTSQCTANKKNEVTRKVESGIGNIQDPAQYLVTPKPTISNSNQPTVPPIIQLGSQEEMDKSQSEAWKEGVRTQLQTLITIPKMKALTNPVGTDPGIQRKGPILFQGS